MKRKNIPTKTLYAERHALLRFLIARAEPTLEHEKIPLEAVYTAYKIWRHEQRMLPTSVGLDGFGRLFPAHVFPRRGAYWPEAGRTLKCVFGLRLL
jgi:hypothetical protein